MAKTIARICKNCKLFDPNKSQCSVVILHEGQRIKLPMDPDDSCFFEEQYFDPTTKSLEDFANEIQEVKFWVEDEHGKKTDKDGKVKVEYPIGFFGDIDHPVDDSPNQ